MAIPHEPVFDAAEYDRRLTAVRAGMAERNIDGLLVFSPHNVFYLCGMDSENLFDFQCLIVPREGELVLVILDFEEARAANSVGAGRTVSYHAFDDPIQAVLDQVGHSVVGPGGAVGHYARGHEDGVRRVAGVAA